MKSGLYKRRILLAGMVSIAVASAQNYTPSIHYNAYYEGGLNSGGGIGEAFNTFTGSPSVKRIRVNVQHGDDLAANFTRQRFTLDYPQGYDSSEFVAVNSQQQILLQLSNITDLYEQTFTINGTEFTSQQVYKKAGAIVKDGVITVIPAGETAVFYDINDAGVAVGARFKKAGSDIGLGHWVPVYFKDGTLTEIPHPSGVTYGFTREDRFIRKDDSAFATSITNEGLILCTGTETPEPDAQDQGGFGAVVCGAGGDSIVFTHQIGSGTSTKIDAFFDAGDQDGYHTATDINASGEIVASQSPWSGLRSPSTNGDNDDAGFILLYLPKANYGRNGGLSFLRPSDRSVAAKMRDAAFFQISDKGQITGVTPSFDNVTDIWDRGTFKDLGTIAETPGFTLKSIVDANEAGQILMLATSTADGPSEGQIYSLVLNGQTGIVVNVITDGEDPDPDDDEIDSDPNTPGQQISLRSAIQAVNASKGDTIRFAIPGSSIPEIALTKALPVVEIPCTIDATTQAAGRVVLKGNSLNAAGLNLQAGETTVKGLILHGFVGEFGTGIRIAGDGFNVVQNCYFGVDATGNQAEALSRGILIAGSTENQIGGGEAGEGNIIWATNYGVIINGSSSNRNRIIGNTIGLGENGESLINTEGKTFIEGTGIFVEEGDNTEIGGPGGLGNTITGSVGILMTANGGVAGTKIEGNRIGLDGNGDIVVGAAVGVFMGGSESIAVTGTTIVDNKIAGHSLVDIWALGAGVTGTSIFNNQIGFKFDDSGEILLQPRNVPAYCGIRTDQGIHTIKDNVIAGQQWNIMVAGAPMVFFIPPTDTNGDGIPDGEGDLEFLDPRADTSPDEEPDNGRDTLIENNHVGVYSDDTVPAGATQLSGISVFGAARNITVRNNTVAGHSLASIYLVDGSDHTIAGNKVGTADGTDQGTRVGVFLKDALRTMIGSGNVIGRCSDAGILIEGDAADTQILGNNIGTDATGRVAGPNAYGIRISDGDDDLEKISINGNTVSGNTEAGIHIQSSADEITLGNNRIGVDTDGAAMSNGIGLHILEGNAEIRSGIFAYNRLAGIAVDGADDYVDLESVSIYENGETTTGIEGILYASAPHSPPSNLGIARSLPDASGNVQMTFVLPVLGATAGSPGLPAIPGETAKIEIFGNPNTDDAQGRTPLFTRNIDPTKTWYEILTVSAGSAIASQRNFTATVTRRGKTSSFSITRVAVPVVTPELKIEPSEAGFVVLSWQNSGISDFYKLEETTFLEDGTSWLRTNRTINNSGTTSTVRVPIEGDSQFFRIVPNPDALLEP